MSETSFCQEFRAQVEPLIQASCIDCHDGSDSSRLDLESLSNDLSDASSFRKWERVFDRISDGEMPPESESRPNETHLTEAVAALRHSLRSTNEHFQKENGRVILRRLTRTEYENTLNDLLYTNAELGDIIPAENASTSFDTVFSIQGISPIHIQGYLKAADVALDSAIQLQAEPTSAVLRFEYLQNKFVRKHLENEENKHVIIGELEDAIVMFSNASYLYKLDHHLEYRGWYTLRAEAYSYQTDKPAILTLNAGSYSRGFTEVLGSFDLQPGETKQVEVTAFLNPGQYLFPGVEGLEVQADGKTIWNVGPDNYQGAGVALKWIELEGPLHDDWPPKSTTNLLKDVELKQLRQTKWDANRQQHIKFELVASDSPATQLQRVVAGLARRAFRRELEDGEELPFVQLGIKALDQGRSIEEAIRIACRAVLVSPEFLFMTPAPGKLDDASLASRLSYFLWKSMPDDELFMAARENRLTDPVGLKAEIERMLADRKAKRFLRDFVNQWLQLSEIDATSPDRHLYPEFDELLKTAMVAETEQFVAHLIEEDLSIANLIDSDFAFLNRRLAEHYGISGVKGQQFRKVQLGPESHRGGILTHASVLKVTANGTTTSPVKRGSWVLTHLLGTPPSPPPPSAGSIEPDTRGTTTIRELLEKHRNDDSCASCHRLIDPPGFALECFDVIGGYRERLRSRETGDRVTTRLHGRNIWEYKLGPAIDASGKLPNGKKFDGIDEYKRLLLSEQDQIARHLIRQLIVYSTGAEIQFADRDEVDRIVENCRVSGYGLRTVIHEVIGSKLFLNK